MFKRRKRRKRPRRRLTHPRTPCRVLVGSNPCSVRERARRVVLGSTPGCRAAATARCRGPVRSSPPSPCGVIRTPPGDDLPERLAALAAELDALVAEQRPRRDRGRAGAVPGERPHRDVGRPGERARARASPARERHPGGAVQPERGQARGGGRRRGGEGGGAGDGGAPAPPRARCPDRPTRPTRSRWRCATGGARHFGARRSTSAGAGESRLAAAIAAAVAREAVARDRVAAGHRARAHAHRARCSSRSAASATACSCRSARSPRWSRARTRSCSRTSTCARTR